MREREDFRRVFLGSFPRRSLFATASLLESARIPITTIQTPDDLIDLISNPMVRQRRFHEVFAINEAYANNCSLQEVTGIDVWQVGPRETDLEAQIHLNEYSPEQF